MRPLFITGIGTDIGKTLVAAIVTEALEAAYWKPVQAGYAQGTDSGWIMDRISHGSDRIVPETYRLSLPASPHIAARKEGITISLDRIAGQFRELSANLPSAGSTISSDPPGLSPDQAVPAFRSDPPAPGPGYPWLVIEGAGGLLVPLNETDFVIDLVKRLDATVILVSRNYLGSINHSLLTASVCQAHGLKVAGWIFNDQYGHYEQEIVHWSGIPAIASIPYYQDPDMEFIREQAAILRDPLQAALNKRAALDK